MAPFVQESATADPNLKAEVLSKGTLPGHNQGPKPVSDDFMYDFMYNHSLPTTDALGIEVPADCNAQKEAEGIVARLSAATENEDAQAFADMFLDYGEDYRENCVTEYCR